MSLDLLRNCTPSVELKIYQCCVHRSSPVERMYTRTPSEALPVVMYYIVLSKGVCTCLAPKLNKRSLSNSQFGLRRF